MRFTSRRAALSEALQVVSRAVTGRTTLPILNNVLVEVKGDQVRLLTSDLEMWVQYLTPAEDVEEGALTVPAKILTEVVGGLPASEVKVVSADGSAAVVTSGAAEYSIQGLSAEEFPAQPEPTGGMVVTVPQAALRTLIRTTEFAASADETRAILTGVLIIWDGKNLGMAATNIYRLATNSLAVEGGPAEAMRAVVPVRALREVMRSLSSEEAPTARVHLGENQARFDLGHVAITSRIIEGQFPNYERVIPQESEHILRADRQELAAALRRADIVARAEADKTILRVEPGTLVIEAESPDIGRAHEEVAIELEGERTEIAFNAQYLIEALEVLPQERVQMDLSGPLSPGVIKPVGESAFLCLVMPLQIT